jgi:chromate transporter
LPHTPRPGFSYPKLFAAMFTLSAFTFGGGYVIVSMMKKRFVDELHWFEEEELLNLTAIAQAAPGAMAINASMLIGHRLGGMRGFFTGLLGAALPPLIIISVISLFYDAFRTNPVVAAMLKTMQAAVAAIMADVVLNMGLKVVKGKSALSILLMVGAFAATYALGVNILWILLAAGCVGALRGYLGIRKERAQ